MILRPRNIVRTVALALLTLLALSCANVVPPSGGPEDKEAPYIDTAAIASGSTNFRGSSVWLEFNEYVDKNRVLENILISPEKRLEYSWSGKELEIRFAEPLDTNTTYALSLGTEYQDLHGNKPKEAYTIVFSTGTMLDSGSIAGNLVDPNPSGVYVLLYPLNGINPDTLDFSHTKARYRTQVGTSGAFSFRALPAGSYRLIALRDEFKNALYDEMDAFGTTVSDVQAVFGTSTVQSLRINPLPDIQPPQLTEVRPKTRSRIEALFSENVDTASILPTSWRLTDSAATKTIEVRAAYITPGNPKSVTLITAPMDSAVFAARLVARNGDMGVRDTAKNISIDSIATQIFSSSAESDTLTPTLLPMSMRDSSRSVALKPVFSLVFNTAVQRSEVEARAGIFKQNSRVETGIEWRGDNEMRLFPKDSLAPDSWYELRIRTNGIHALNGMSVADSIIRLRFASIDTRNFGAMKGVLVDSAQGATNTKAAYILILSDKNKQRRTLRLASPGAFSFNNLPEGEYTLEAFCDENGDGMYTAGRAKPYTHAERFLTRQAPITIKARWTVEDIKIQFNP